MRNLKKFEGLSLEAVAEQTGVFEKPLRVFLLAGPGDTAGRPLISGYTVRQLIRQAPILEHAVVASAENYYGDAIFRVRVY